MNREVHVRLREGVGVKFPRATRPPNAGCVASQSLLLVSFLHKLLYPDFCCEVVNDQPAP